MYNKYTIEVFQDSITVKDPAGKKHDIKQTKATIYLGKDCLGTVWRPKTTTKGEIQDLMESVGNVIYGKENKAKQEEESYSEIIKIIDAKNSTKQEEEVPTV